MTVLIADAALFKKIELLVPWAAKMMQNNFLVFLKKIHICYEYYKRSSQCKIEGFLKFYQNLFTFFLCFKQCVLNSMEYDIDASCL